MTSCVFDCGVEIGEEVLVMTQRIEHSDGPEELLVTRLHSLDQDGDTAPLEGADDLAEDAGAGGVDEFELRHPQNHHGDALHPGDGLEDAVGGREEQRTVEADDRDPLVAGSVAPASASRRTPVARDRLRRAKTPAHTTPIATATIRSNDTVITAVRRNATASERVDRSTERMVARCTIRTAVTISTPASAASGMRPTGPAATRTTRSRTAEWKSAAIRVRPPDRTLTAVRAIAPVAGIPPNRPEPIDARP